MFQPALAALALVTVLAAFGETPAQGAQAGRVIEFIGRGTVLRAGATTASPLSSYAVLWPGDRVESGRRSMIQLKLANGALVKLGADTALTLTTDVGAPSLRLDRGHMTYLNGDDSALIHATRTPHATLSVEPGTPVRRASFTVEVRREPGSTGVTEVCSERGTVLAAATSGVQAAVTHDGCVAISHDTVNATERRRYPMRPVVQPPRFAPDPPPRDEPWRPVGDASGRMRLPS